MREGEFHPPGITPDVRNQTDKEDYVTPQRQNPEIPQVQFNEATGQFIDAVDGEVWLPKNSLRDRYKVFGSLRRTAFDGVPRVIALQRGRPVFIYQERAIRERMEMIRGIRETYAMNKAWVDPQTGKKWVTKNWLRGEYGLSSRSLVQLLAGVGPLPDSFWKVGYDVDLYPEDEIAARVALIREHREIFEREGVYVDEVGKKWVPANHFATTYRLRNSQVTAFTRGIELLDDTVYKVGCKVKLYPEEVVRVRIENSRSLGKTDVDEVYVDLSGQKFVTLRVLQDRYSKLSKGDVERIVEKIFPTPLVTFKYQSVGGGMPVYLYPEKLVGDIFNRPFISGQSTVHIDENGDRWASVHYFSVKFGVHPISCRNLLERGGVRRMLAYRKTGSHPKILYNEDEFILQLSKSGLVDRRKVKEERIIEERLRTDLKYFLTELRDEKARSKENFNVLIGFFGASRAVDILFAHHPKYRGIPVEQVRSMIAEYLGEFLVVKAPLNLYILPLAEKYLTDPDWERDLYETLKADCFERHQKTARKDRNNFFTIQEYIDEARAMAKSAGSDKLNTIIERVYEYYRSVFQDVAPIPGIVDSLKVGREFPDYNQRINIKEIREKKRMLLADEMGLGKSASAILAKEQLGMKTALVVVPANVLHMGSWQEYLSDDRERGGYFEQGMAPRVFVIEDLKALENFDSTGYDYILISHERLAEDEYVEYLEGMGFDMLIVDEVHKFKNIKKGIRAENLMRVAASMDREKSYLALLSGTPIPNKVGDIAITLKLLYPEEFGEMDNAELVHRIVNGEVLNLRALLVARMQMKNLAESIEMPPLTEHQINVGLSKIEHDVYEVLLEEDELNSLQKMHVLRQFLLNPELVDATPGLPSAKIEALDHFLQDAFEKHDKIVVFVNDYIEGVIRGDRSILHQLHIPSGVEIRTIEGDASTDERIAIQKELNELGGRMVVFVSGKTADVGVDFSGADVGYFYNEPWTKYDLLQQRGRIYREGLRHPLDVYTSIVAGTIEEGVHAYIEAKQKAVEKLLHGIPLSEIEKELVLKEEDREPDLQVNPELAEYYFSAWDKLMKIFGYVKEIGEKDFRNFLQTYGREYAECYTDLGARSYHANGSRVVGTLVDEFVHARGQDASRIRILDLASGPEMLKQHILPEYQDRVFSIDLNRYHFKRQGDHRVVGSMIRLPLDHTSMDYVNLSFALHYTKFRPAEGNLERLQVLAEVNRVLKPGGRALINLIYSIDFMDFEHFHTVANTLGFRVVEEYSGAIEEGRNYRSRLVTLEKERELPSAEDGSATDNWGLLDAIGVENRDGLRFAKQEARLKDTRRILQSFMLGEQRHNVLLNENDQRILAEEQSVLDDAASLQRIFGSIKDIPKEDVVRSGFIRILVETKYILFKKLEQGNGIVVVRE